MSDFKDYQRQKIAKKWQRMAKAIAKMVQANLPFSFCQIRHFAKGLCKREERRKERGEEGRREARKIIQINER